MRWPLVVALLATAACDRVLGLDEREPPPDAPPVYVTGQFARRWITNNAMGLPVRNEAAYPADSISIAVYIGGGPPIAAEIDDEGRFSFERPDDETPYRLRIIAEGRRLEIEHTAATLQLANNSVGRPNDQRTPVTQSTLVVLPKTASPPRVVSTGLWTSSPATLNSDNDFYFVDWLAAAPLSGRRGLLERTHNDRLYYFDYVEQAGGYATVRQYLEIPDIQMNDGATVVYATGLLNATNTECVHIIGQRAQEVARLVAAAPAYTSPESNWTILAIPDPAFGGMGGIEIASHPGITSETIDDKVMFFNPIRGSTPFVGMGSTISRSIAAPGALPMPVFTAVRTFVALTDPSACPTPVDLTSSAAIAGEATFDGVPLVATDDAVITLGVRERLDLTWPVIGDGSVDRYTAALYELFEDPASGRTTSRLLRDVATVKPSATFDAAVFVPGASYMFSLTTTTGLPGIRDGDFTTVTYPLHQSLTYTGVFVVE